MERKIGEIFEYNGEWYQIVEAPIDEHSCNGCQGCKGTGGPRIFGGECNGNARKDNKFVIFKKLEKVGEPYSDYCPSGRVIYFQKYKCYQKPIYTGDIVYWADDIHISLEIKQTKEDMEEKKLNLKPFDIQKAREGKPVCTRDGHKARIICFDKQEGFPIIALVETKVNDRISEEIALFNINGRAVSDDIDSKLDLMMLPEKKEGWVNIDKGGSGKITISSPYSTKEEAIHNDNETTIDTIKISWEE